MKKIINSKKFEEKVVTLLLFIMIFAITPMITFILIDACSTDAEEPQVIVETSYDYPEEIFTEPEIIYEVVKHVVEAGDNYWTISDKYYGTGLYYKALARYNGKETNSIIYVGDVVKVPNLLDPEFLDLYNLIMSENAESIKTWNEMMAGKTIPAGINTGYRYGQRSNPAVNITIPKLDELMKNYTGNVDTSSFQKLGSYRITGYTPSCAHCCENTDGTGASGVEMICGYSVAAPSNIPFGTTLYIEGYGFYVVEDRGYLGDSTIDIACPTHDACYDITARNINVYIVPNN